MAGCYCLHTNSNPQKRNRDRQPVVWGDQVLPRIETPCRQVALTRLDADIPPCPGRPACARTIRTSRPIPAFTPAALSLWSAGFMSFPVGGGTLGQCA